MRIQKNHNIWRLISAVLDATGQQIERCAFLNILPFRTRNDRPAPAALLKRSIESVLRPQLDALRPGRIFALGLKANHILERMGQIGEAKLIALPRTIGDSYLAPATLAILQELAAERRPANQ
jgi:hypothetical protein